ncbi:MAG: hydantoinase B/oxoprolinase family protein [Chloroflexi bacterium]|nr:hydantoinase B/oxoprolinase family protein [Chloroflexota bacterium]
MYSQTRTLDPITVEVIGNALSSIVEEMGMALIRASYSTNIKERRDCSTALFDARGQTLAQAEHIPIHLGSLLGIVEEITRRYPPSQIRPGDVFIGNDAYSGGGTHLPDIVLASPVFFEGEIVAYAANLADHADFVDRGHAHIYQEGLRIPVVRLYNEDNLQEDVLELILLNCQVPKERIADLRAQYAANRVGVVRFQNLCEKYGRETVRAAGDELLNYAERKTRTGIAGIPDGVYRFVDSFDSEELPDVLQLGVEITVQDDRMHLAFDGPPQVRSSLNMVWTALLATVYYAVKTVVDPTILPNAGLYRAITVSAPKGSILNCDPPAAVAARTQTCQRVVDLVHGALAPAVPDRIIAACNGTNAGMGFSGVDPRTGNFYVYKETQGGGFGARATKDGMEGVQVHVTNTSNLPVECLESEYPLMVDRYELVLDSGGPGRWRGGMGVHRQIHVVEGEALASRSITRVTTAPWGLFGGKEGAGLRMVLHRDPNKGPACDPYLLRTGEGISLITPGGGGYGDPRARDRELVARDLREEKISREQAAAAYGYTPR